MCVLGVTIAILSQSQGWGEGLYSGLGLMVIIIKLVWIPKVVSVSIRKSAHKTLSYPTLISEPIQPQVMI